MEDSIDDMVQELTNELTQLEQDILTLALQEKVDEQNLDRLLGVAERIGSQDATQRATQAEGALETVRGSLRRKRAAVAATKKELQIAQAEQSRLQAIAALTTFEATITALGLVASSVDDSPTKAELWVDLAASVQRAKAAYAALNLNGQARTELFVDPSIAFRRVFDLLGRKIDYSLGGSGEGLKEIPTIAEAIGVSKAQAHIQWLRATVVK